MVFLGEGTKNGYWTAISYGFVSDTDLKKNPPTISVFHLGPEANKEERESNVQFVLICELTLEKHASAF